MTYFISWRMKDIYCLIKDIRRRGKGVEQVKICLAAFIYCRPGLLPPQSLSTLQVQFLHPFPNLHSLNASTLYTLNKLTKLRTCVSQVHFAKIHFQEYTLENKLRNKTLWKSGLGNFFMSSWTAPSVLRFHAT